jgi:hypothetical protein
MVKQSVPSVKIETAGSSETPVNHVTSFHNPKSSLFKFSKVKAIQRNINDLYINFVRAMKISDSSPYDNTSEDVWEQREKRLSGSTEGSEETVQTA